MAPPNFYTLSSRRSLAVVALVCIATTCTKPPEREGALREVAETILEESDSSFVGVMAGFAVTSRGTFLVADKRNATIHEYGRSGTEIRRMGRRGEGPGEWANGPQVIVWGSDSTLLVADGFMARALEYPSLTQRWSSLRPTWSLPMGYINSRWIFNKVDAIGRTSLQFLSSASDSALAGGPVTPSIGTSKIIDDYFSFLAVAAARADTIGVFVMNADRLYFGPAPAGPWDSIDVPALRRRGSVPSLMEALARGDTKAAEKGLYDPSFPVALKFLPNRDEYALVTSDRKLEGGSRMTGKLYLSVIRPRVRTTCVDIPLPLPDDPQPQVVFRGDTLFALAQYADNPDSVRTTVRAFLLATEGCAT